MQSWLLSASMISIRPVPQHQYEFALQFLFQDEPPADRLTRTAEILESVKDGALSLDGLLIAETQGGSQRNMLGVMLFVLQDDGIGFVWPPVCREVFPEKIAEQITPRKLAGQLLQETARRLDAAGAWLGQCMLEPDDDSNSALFLENGFQHLADLLFLSRPLSLPISATVFSGHVICYERGNQELRDRFADVLTRTYEGSQDCPVLNGIRDAEQTLRCHESTGQFHPNNWFLFQKEGIDCGLLLMGDHPQDHSWEVAYMGVVPEFRGQGLGGEIMQFGFQRAKQAGRHAVFLAVDRRNHFAESMYRKLGFQGSVVQKVLGRIPAESLGEVSNQHSENL